MKAHAPIVTAAVANAISLTFTLFMTNHPPFALSLSKGPCIESLSNGLSLSKDFYREALWLGQAQPERSFCRD
jgi:hypothetical protein